MSPRSLAAHPGRAAADLARWIPAAADGEPSHEASTAMWLALKELEADGRAWHMYEGPARWYPVTAAAPR